MQRILKKDQIITIPNILSFFRILLIPALIWAYCVKENYIAAMLIFTLSAVTDVADGIIARKFNMVSDFGKIIDPVADKLTQFSLIICLALNFKLMFVLIGLFFLKEVILAVMGCYVIKQKGQVNSAKWHGKINTILLYIVMVALIVFPNIPVNVANILICICAVSMLTSFILYVLFYMSLLIKE